MNASYVFTTYKTILTLTKEELLQVGYHTNDSNPIPSFDQELLINLCSDAQQLFSQEDVVLEIDGDVIVIGDIHGSLHDLLRIINYIESSHCKALFLGDYVDRGNFSLECITLLFALKILYPNNYYLLRGNHEFDIICSQYGFKKEIVTMSTIPKGNSLPRFAKYSPNKSGQELDQMNSPQVFLKDDSLNTFFKTHSNLCQYKYDESLYNAFIKTFSYLPISAIINKSSICIHGGISPQLTKIDIIRNSIHRPVDNFDNELLCDLLWGDPSYRASKISPLFEENPRGKGKLFSGIAISEFLKNNFLRRLIRGHECVNHGTETKFNEKCITVFSASSYNKEMGNKSGILKVLKNEDKIEPVTFSPIAQLNRSNANFFKVEPFFVKMSSRLPTKPVFTMTTVRAPIAKTQGERLFKKNNDHVLNSPQSALAAASAAAQSLAASATLFKSGLNKNVNGCPIVQVNRKPVLIGKNIRSVNGSFAFNTGIQHKRQSSVNNLPQMNMNGMIKRQNAYWDFQSDNQAEMEVENMEQRENGQDL